MTSILLSLQILNVSSHTLATAAPSTKVSMFSSVVFFQASRLVFILAAPAGSTPMISVSFWSVFLAVMSPDITHPPQIGAIIISTSSSLSYISKPIVA